MFVLARAEEHAETLAYRVYVTESLRVYPESRMSRPYLDLIRPREEIDVDAIIERVLEAATSE